MIKVRVQRVGTQIAVMGGMAAATVTATGCGDTDAEVSRESNDIQEVTPLFTGGDVTFDISGWPGAGQSIDFVISSSTTDEFLRVGQKLTFDIPALTLWDWVHPGGPTPTFEQVQAVKATITMTALDKGKPFSEFSAETVSWKGADLFLLRAVTTTAIIPAKTDEIRFSMTIVDTTDNSMVVLDQDQFVPQPAFGGELPTKTMLFDTALALRERIIEGDDPVAGSSILFGYSDWRADTLVDASSIDRQIGTQLTNGRFGQVTVPVFGTIEHDVGLAIYFDDGLEWRPELPLPMNKNSRLLGPGRTSFEANVDIPEKASRLALYVHVRTYLVANYPAGGVVTKWYADGEKILKADKYDNPGGQPFVNYQYGIDNR
jgi:hypothetical protein